MSEYKILLNKETYQNVMAYLKAVKDGKITTGAYLRKNLQDFELSQMEVNQFIERLINTKEPQIFAESAVSGDGQDWNQTELSLLGDMGIAVPVTVYDNGEHNNPTIHALPFKAALLYVPGALLRNDQGLIPADWEEVTRNGDLDFVAYFALYERRLLPSFMYANDVAKAKNKKAFITIPGLGCGQFAGKFRGHLGAELRNVLVKFLEKHNGRFLNIRAVYYDPYSEGSNERLEIGELTFFVRPLTKGNYDKPQLCEPTKYEEQGDDFSNCDLFSFVAWDHVSWPGNDFYIGSRGTDDGVKAAATDSMAVMTGIEGRYNARTYKYDPPNEYANWEDVILKNSMQIHAQNNLLVE